MREATFRHTMLSRAPRGTDRESEKRKATDVQQVSCFVMLL